MIRLTKPLPKLPAAACPTSENSTVSSRVHMDVRMHKIRCMSMRESAVRFNS